MSRFEIQELLSQSDLGITYLAFDKDQQCHVALRRCLLPGRHEDLNEKQIAEFKQSCIRFSTVTHPNLRRVVEGGVDRLDGTPYLVTEWVDGKPVTDWLAGTMMDQETARHLAKCALDVSMALSQTHGEEAVWIDTTPNTIIVADGAGQRGFTFWVCLSKCFGTRPLDRRIGSVATLMEKLMGWDIQTHAAESAGEFGDWLRMIKNSPEISVREALKRLEAISGNKGRIADPPREKKWVVTPPPSPKIEDLQRGWRAPAPMVPPPHAYPFIRTGRSAGPIPAVPTGKQSSNPARPVIIATACISCVLGIALLIKHNRDTVHEQLLAQQVAYGSTQDGKSMPPAANLEPESLDTPVTGTKPPDPGTIRTATQTEPQTARSVLPVAGPKLESDRILNINQTASFTDIKPGQSIRVKGVISPDGLVQKNNQIIMRFEGESDKKCIRGLAIIEKGADGITMQALGDFKGKEVVLDGEFTWIKRSGRFVIIRRMSQIRLAD